MTSRRAQLGIGALSAVFLACGRLEMSGTGDAGQDADQGDALHSGDAGSDAPEAHRQDGPAVETDAPVDGGCAPPHACADASDAPAHFDGCTPYPCSADQYCVNIVAPSGTETYAYCPEIPKTCEPDPTCGCLEHAVECQLPECAGDAGQFSLMCTRGMGGGKP
jgi:hypothetical protein